MLNPNNESQSSVIDIRNVSFTYPGSELPVLNEVNLTIEPGSFTAIIGGNGSGKSTLCKLLNGLIPHYYSGDFEGEVHIHGQSIAQKPSPNSLAASATSIRTSTTNLCVLPCWTRPASPR
ncbi:hypothetical protein HMSSN139_07760 [Paenibacillus sp. HMSSN-139]|nr:hypothetical protein HMSSN139_07760 [Paenibacillus sp. HMSSN-139]